MSLKYGVNLQPVGVLAHHQHHVVMKAPLSVYCTERYSSQFKNNCFTEMLSGSSYLRPIDGCITQLKAQGPSRTCNESKEEGENLQPVGVLAHHQYHVVMKAPLHTPMA